MDRYSELNNSLLKAIIENSHDLITLLNKDFLPVYRSPSTERILGWAHEDRLGIQRADEFHPDDREKMAGVRTELLANPGKIISVRFRFLHKQGHYIWLEGTFTNLLHDPNVEAVIINCKDETERIKAEENLKASEIRFRTLIESSNDIISMQNGNSQIIYRSPSSARITGWSDEEILQTDTTRLVHPEDAPKLKKAAMHLRENPGKPVSFLYRFLHKTGNYIWLEGSAVNLLPDENIKATVFNFRDVSERKEQEKQQELFSSIVNSTGDAILTKNLDGIITSWNPGAEKTFGYTAAEIIGKHISILIPPHLQNEEKEIIKKMRKGKYVAHYETERICKDGRTIFVTLSISPVKDADGKIIGESKICRDITERKRAEAEVLKLKKELEQKVAERTDSLQKTIDQLRESEELFEKAFQSSAAGITITRLSDSRFMNVNDAFSVMTGFSKAELIGYSSRELGMIVNIEKREKILEMIRRDGGARNFEMSVRHKSGALLDILASVETIVVKGERYALNIIYDITERKRTEEQLISVNNELSAFSYSVSHDLRAPLRAVSGYAQMLFEDYEDKLDEEGIRIINLIKYNATKMGKLIDDLLAFSKLGRKEIQKVKIDLNELVEGVLIDLNKLVEHKAEIKIGKLPVVKADYNLLHQAVLNLIGNAVKYSSLKAEPVVEISSEKINNETVVSIKDNGAGFDMKYSNKLFGVFQRLHSQEEFEGTGVGLAIVQRVINKHGGNIWAEGKINEGAAFHFTLPDK